MKKFLSLLTTIFIYILFFSSTIFYNIEGVNAFSFSDIFSNWWWDIPYCDDDDCWLDEWIEEIKDVNLIETDKSASEFVQDVIKFVLWFLALISVLIIIYSWFILLVWLWDEEKAKKTKQIIIYAIAWLAIIFLAYPITDFIFRFLSQ